jgi:thymidylate kinase
MQSHPGLLISLSGIDGCGKSTIARQLQEYFSSECELPSSTLWCKFGAHPFSKLHISDSIKRASFPAPHPLSFPILGERGGRGVSEGCFGAPFPQTYARILLLLHFAHIFFAVRQKLLRGELIICDRYIFDTAVDLQQEFQYSTEKIRHILSIRWLPMPDFKFWLDLPERAAYQRKPDTESVMFLRERRALYRAIAQEFDLHVIDASRPLELVLNQVVEIIDKQLQNEKSNEHEYIQKSV